MLEGLIPQTEYTVRVRANCGEGQESEWSYTSSFKTLCNVITVTDDEPYTDDFEGSDEFICWQDEILSGTLGWAVAPTYLNPNNTAFFIWLGEEAMLVSAPLDITAVSNPVFTFKHKQQQLDGRTDELSVWYATSLDDYWHLLAEYTYACDDWESVTHSLPEASSTYYIAFKGKSNNADGVYVDDVWVGNDDGVGIGETSSVKAVVSPNPTNGKVMLDANVSEGEVAVFDTMGKQVAFATLNNGRAELDLSAFAKGVYVARITTEAGTSIIKLVKE